LGRRSLFFILGLVVPQLFLWNLSKSCASVNVVKGWSWGIGGF
jgi:hypothetical protein